MRYPQVCYSAPYLPVFGYKANDRLGIVVQGGEHVDQAEEEQHEELQPVAVTALLQDLVHLQHGVLSDSQHLHPPLSTDHRAMRRFRLRRDVGLIFAAAAFATLLISFNFQSQLVRSEILAGLSSGMIRVDDF